MIKFYLRTVKLIFLFVVLLLCLHSTVAISTCISPKIENRLFGQTNEWGDSYFRMTDFQSWLNSTFNQPKGVILGASTAYRNINPYILDNETNINWFNLGSSSQPPIVSFTLLKQITKSTNHNLSYVILDLSIPILENDGYESSFDLITYSKMSFFNKVDLFSIHPSLKLLNHLMYKSIKTILPSKDYVVKNPSNGEYLGKGFTCSPKSRNKLKLNDFKKGSQLLRMTSEIYNIMNLCNKNHIKLYINVAPELNVKTIGKIKKATIIYNDYFNNKTDFFYDSHHMNCYGANIYTKKIGREILSINTRNIFK